MRYIGLTGNIASGKSAVADELARRGATIIDADELARRAVAPGMPALDAIRQRWGDRVINPDGTLNRKAMRERVFGNPQELEALNAIVHPEVGRLRAIEVEHARTRGDRLVVYVVPLLFEANLQNEFDAIILVHASEATRLQRLVEHRGLAPEVAKQMIDAQLPSELKRERSDYIIENDGSLAQLHDQVAAMTDLLS